MTDKQYSSFQIAKLLNVSRQAVNQWIDKGYIASYRTPGGHRRVAGRDLLNFLNTRNIPIPDELRDKSLSAAPTQSFNTSHFTIDLMDHQVDYLNRLSQTLRVEQPGTTLRLFRNPFDLLLAWNESRPDLLVLGIDPHNISDRELIESLKQHPLAADVKLLLLAPEDRLEAAQLLSHGEMTALSRRDESPELLVRRMVRLMTPVPVRAFA